MSAGVYFTKLTTIRRTELAEMLSDEHQFAQLVCTSLVSADGSSAQCGFPTPISVLLQHDGLQTAALDAVLEGLAVFGDALTKVQREAALSSLRSLYFIRSVSSLLSSLQLQLPVMPPALQRGVLELLPQLANDVTAMDAATELLRAQLSADPDSVQVLLDAASALCLPPPLLRDLLGDVHMQLQAVPKQALPAVIAFTMGSLHALQAHTPAVQAGGKRARLASSAGTPHSTPLDDSAFVDSAPATGMTRHGALGMVLQCIRQSIPQGGGAASAGGGSGSSTAECLQALQSACSRRPDHADEWVQAWQQASQAALGAPNARDSHLHIHVAVLALWAAAAALAQAHMPSAVQCTLAASKLLASMPPQQQDAELQHCVGVFARAGAHNCRLLVKTLLALFQGGAERRRGGGKMGARTRMRSLHHVLLQQVSALVLAASHPQVHGGDGGVLDGVVFSVMKTAVTGGAAAQAACVECLLRVGCRDGGVAVLSRYWDHVVNILDHCPRLEPAFVHGMYTLLLLLQVAPDASLHHELSVLVQKQLHSTDPSYLVCGVFGAIAQLRWAAWAPLVEGLGSAPPDTAEAYAAGTQNACASQSAETAIAQLLSGTLDQLQERPDAAALFLGSVAVLVRGLGQQVQAAPSAAAASQSEQRALWGSYGDPAGQPGAGLRRVQRAFSGWGMQQLQQHAGKGGAVGGPHASTALAWMNAPALPLASLPAVFGFMSRLWECASLAPAILLHACADDSQSAALQPPTVPPSAVAYSTALCAAPPSTHGSTPLVLRLPSIVACSSGQADQPSPDTPFLHGGVLYPLLAATAACAEQSSGSVLQVEDFLNAAVELPAAQAAWVGAWTSGSSAPAAPDNLQEDWEELGNTPAVLAAHLLATAVTASNWFRAVLNIFAFGVSRCEPPADLAQLQRRAVQLYLSAQAIEAWLLTALAVCAPGAAVATQRLLAPQHTPYALQGTYFGDVADGAQPVAVAGMLPPWHSAGDPLNGPAPEQSLGGLSKFLTHLLPHAAALLVSIPTEAWPARCVRCGCAPAGEGETADTLSPAVLCSLVDTVSSHAKGLPATHVSALAGLHVLVQASGPDDDHHFAPGPWAVALFALIQDCANVAASHTPSRGKAELSYKQLTQFLCWVIKCIHNCADSHPTVSSALVRHLAAALLQVAPAGAEDLAAAAQAALHAPAAGVWLQHGGTLIHRVFLFLLRQLESTEAPALVLAACDATEALLGLLGTCAGGEELTPQLRWELSNACEDVLRTPPAEDCRWKPGQVGGVMRVWLTNAPRPAQCILQACKETMAPLMGPAGATGHLSLLTPKDVVAAVKALTAAAAQGVVCARPPPPDKAFTEGPAFLATATSAVSAFKHVVSLSKQSTAHCPPVALTAMLRGGASCLVAAKAWTPLLSRLLALDAKGVVACLKHMQNSGRQLHAIAAHLQSAGHTAAANATGAFRRRQEEWLFAVKRILADAGLGDAFWMGNLKSKDLQGEALGSQLVTDVPPSSPPSQASQDGDGSSDRGEEGEGHGNAADMTDEEEGG